MVTIPKIEFYINHTCNLTCNNCNRFNNHSFVGWQNFNDYAEQIEQWSQYIDIEQIVIMGGEPLLNPSLLDWVLGLRRLWPNPGIQILTNGTRLSKNKDLYNTILADQSIWLGISWHNTRNKQQLVAQIEQFVTLPLQSKPTDEQLSQAKTGDCLEFVDDEGIKIQVWVQDEFGPAAVRIEDGKFTLHNSDPEQAHQSCGFAQYKCYHMIEGKLYKCGPVALMPAFDKQHHLNISEEDRRLLNSYTPLSLHEFEVRGEEFLKNIDKVIPQCKFCPVGWQHNPDVIYPEVKNKK